MEGNLGDLQSPQNDRDFTTAFRTHGKTPFQRRISPQKPAFREAFSKAVWLHQGVRHGARTSPRKKRVGGALAFVKKTRAMERGKPERGATWFGATRGQRAERRLLFDGRVAMQLEIAEAGRYAHEGRGR